MIQTMPAARVRDARHVCAHMAGDWVDAIPL